MLVNVYTWGSFRFIVFRGTMVRASVFSRLSVASRKYKKSGNGIYDEDDRIESIYYYYWLGSPVSQTMGEGFCQNKKWVCICSMSTVQISKFVRNWEASGNKKMTADDDCLVDDERDTCCRF